MKSVLITLMLSLVSIFGQQLKAQKYFVYDGDLFSVMFVCDDNNTKINEIQFSFKDSNGEWKWNKFEIYDYENLENPDSLDSLFLEDDFEPGFIYYCKDAQNKKYAVDYYRTSDYVLVYNVDDEGNIGKTQWRLTRRPDK